ncbi:nuclear pore assembly and biogenesis-domain-containing protein [Aspergillus pseudoustus]|uniref:Nuclear pore assembly and biogenesis-domain-containing protein n=1 Tax=Aspergillus pseudoustus TaxID=1810923 RepID=A0ABR4J0S8_9EURO
MDNLQEYIQSLLQHPTIQHLASSPLASNLAHLHVTYLNPSVAHLKESYLDPSLAHLRLTYLDPYIVQPLAHLLASMPDLASVLVLVFILFVSFKVLDYTRRAVMFWVWLTMRLAWWATIISLGLYMYQAGWAKVARDLGFVFNFLVGLLEQFGHGLEESTTARAGERPSRGSWQRT